MNPDPAPNPAIFVIDLQDVNKKTIIILSFSALLFAGIFT
jgi:hypothetical protein